MEKDEFKKQDDRVCNEISDDEIEPLDLSDIYYKQWREEPAIFDRMKTEAKKVKVWGDKNIPNNQNTNFGICS